MGNVKFVGIRKGYLPRTMVYVFKLSDNIADTLRYYTNYPDKDLEIELSIAGRVVVKGRGGTVLQPAVDLLENAKDFPKDGPILIITDAGIENDLKVHHEHAFLIPQGKQLPFRPKGKVFYYI